MMTLIHFVSSHGVCSLVARPLFLLLALSACGSKFSDKSSFSGDASQASVQVQVSEADATGSQSSGDGEGISTVDYSGPGNENLNSASDEEFLDEESSCSQCEASSCERPAPCSETHEDSKGNSRGHGKADSAKEGKDESGKGNSKGGSTLAECARAFGENTEKIHVVSSKGLTVIPADKTAIYLKVTGNQSQVEINISSTKNSQIKGICLFATGNQSKVNVKIDGVVVDSLLYKGRGNESATQVVVQGEGNLKNASADLAGNQASLNFIRSSQKECDDFMASIEKTLRGNKPSLTCEVAKKDL